MDKKLPKKIIILTDAEEIKAYVHPIRQTILRYLTDNKMTVSMVAKEINVHPANITHHFRILEKTKLIKLVEKRDTGRNLEKYYRATAFSYVVNTDSMDITDKRVTGLTILKNDLESAIQRTQKSPEVGVLAFFEKLIVAQGDLEWIKSKLEDLGEELKRRNGGKGERYTANIGIYPDQLEKGEKENEIIIK